MVVASQDGPVKPARRLRTILPVAVALMVALLAVAVVLPTWPSVTLRNAVTRSTPTPRVFTQTYWVKNTGHGGLTIRRVDSGGPGVEMVGSNLVHGIAIPAGHTARIVTTYRVTDCRRAPEVLPVQLRFDEWWGTKTITVQDHGVDFDGAHIACVPVTK